MPNYCSNNLYFSNLTELQAEEIDKAIEEERLLATYYPMPVELQNDGYSVRDEDTKAENIAKYGEPDGYHWCNENWGTKWEMWDGSSYVSRDSVTASFTTAWTPPVEGLRVISTKFPEATIILTYSELGCDFAGGAQIKNGIVSELELVAPCELLNQVVQEQNPEITDEDELWDIASEIQDEVMEELMFEIFARTGKLKLTNNDEYFAQRQREKEAGEAFAQAALASIK